MNMKLNNIENSFNKFFAMILNMNSFQKIRGI